MYFSLPFSNPLRLFLYSTAILLLFSSLTLAQTESTSKTDAGNGGRNTLQGDLILPNGQRLDHPVLVRLSTPRGEITTTSNSNGSFIFRQLTAGRYSVRVDAGDSFAIANETIDIAESGAGGAMSRIGQIYTLQVYLRLKPSEKVNKGVIAASEPPKEAEDLYNMALQSAENGHRDKAIEQLKAALAIHPSFVAALNGLGVQYLKLGKNQDALEAFSRALKLTPDNFILLLNCGISLYNLTRHAEAETEFAAALLKNEGSAIAHLYRARALIGLRRLEDAVADLKRVVEIGGEEVKLAHRYLGGIYMEMGNNEQAVKELELYLKLSPNVKEADQIKALIKELNKRPGGG